MEISSLTSRLCNHLKTPPPLEINFNIHDLNEDYSKNINEDEKEINNNSDSTYDFYDYEYGYDFNPNRHNYPYGYSEDTFNISNFM